MNIAKKTAVASPSPAQPPARPQEPLSPTRTRSRGREVAGVLSGNVVPALEHVPVNVCGNTVNVIALLNPAFGDACKND
jgi:hypothetical protein